MGKMDGAVTVRKRDKGGGRGEKRKKGGCYRRH